MIDTLITLIKEAISEKRVSAALTLIRRLEDLFILEDRDTMTDKLRYAAMLKLQAQKIGDQMQESVK